MGSGSPRLFGLDGRSATLLNSGATALFCFLWAGQGFLGGLLPNSAEAAGFSDTVPEDVGEHELEHQDFAIVLSFSHFCALATSACALVGFCGAYSKHLPWIRFYALYSIAESGVYALVLASLGVLTITTASRDILAQAVCTELTTGAHRQSLWTTSLLDGLESCEESFHSILLPLWVATTAFLLLKWQFVDCTLAWYHHLVKRQSVFGKPTASTYDTIPLSSVASPSSKSPRFSNSDRPRSRTMSTSMRHLPTLSLVASPYAHQTLSPKQGESSTIYQPDSLTSSPATYAGQGAPQQALQRRQSHVAQPSHHEHQPALTPSPRQNYLIYAPVALVPLEEAGVWAADDSPIQQKRARAATAFAALKGYHETEQGQVDAALREAEAKTA